MEVISSYRLNMEKVVTIHRSHEAAEEADNAYYRSLTPEQRLNIILELTQPDETQPRLERVYRIVELSQS